MVKQTAHNKTVAKVASNQTDKDLTKPISFRVDADLHNKISKLERTRKESKSLIIKEAIEKSFNQLIFSSIHQQLYLISKSIFKKIHFVSSAINSATKLEEDGAERLPFVNEPQGLFRCIAVYDLNSYPCYKDLNKTEYCLNRFLIELTGESNNTIKLKVSAIDVIKGNSDKIDSDLFLKITQLANKRNMQIETNGESRDGLLAISIFFERRTSFTFDEWSNKFKQELKLFKDALDKIALLYQGNKSLIKKEENNQLHVSTMK